MITFSRGLKSICFTEKHSEAILIQKIGKAATYLDKIGLIIMKGTKLQSQVLVTPRVKALKLLTG